MELVTFLELTRACLVLASYIAFGLWICSSLTAFFFGAFLYVLSMKGRRAWMMIRWLATVPRIVDEKLPLSLSCNVYQVEANLLSNSVTVTLGNSTMKNSHYACCVFAIGQPSCTELSQRPVPDECLCNRIACSKAVVNSIDPRWSYTSSTCKPS